MLNNGKKLIIGVFGVLSLILLLTAAAYAFFSSTSLGDQIVRLTTNGVTFSYKEGTNTIRLNNAMPMTDEEGMHSSNYFEFDITSKTSKKVSVPYYITARKGSSSSNIDEAIKLYLTRAVKTNKDIYNIHTVYNNISYNLCNEDLGLSNDVAKMNCTKTNLRGESLSGYYLSLKLETQFDTLEACQNSYDYNEATIANWGPECISNEDKYIIQGYGAYYDDLATCQIETSGLGNIECIYKETLPIDLYHNDIVFIDNSFDTMDECNSYYNNSSFNYNVINNNINYSTTCALTNARGDVVDEEPIILINYSELNQFSHNSIDLSRYTEKLLHEDRVPFNSADYSETYRLRTWIDYDTDFSLAKYNNATFSLTVNVYSSGAEKPKLAAGLYDVNNNLIASYEELVNDYGWDLSENDLTCYLDNEIWYCSREDEMLGNYINTDDLPNNLLAKILLNDEFSSVTKVVLPEGITEIPTSTFTNCENLTSIEIPESVTTIGKFAFSYCDNLTDIELPEGITTIGAGAFYYCISLPNIKLPPNITAIAYETFNHCISLTNISIPQAVTEIGDLAFSDCTGITNIDLPSNLITISGGAFSGCTSLTSVTIPASVTSLGVGAFSSCFDLENVILTPNSSLSSIGSCAFDNTAWYQNESHAGTASVYLNGILIEICR